MSWAILSDDFHENGKILSFSHAAFRLFVCSVTYCRAHRTKGVLTHVQATALARMQGVNPKRTAAELVAKKGWDPLEAGYRIHDYEEFYSGDPTASERMRRYRNRTVTNTVTEPEQHRNGHRNVLERESLSPSLSLSNTPTPTPSPAPTVTGANAVCEENDENREHRGPRRLGPAAMAVLGKGPEGPKDHSRTSYTARLVELTQKYGHPLPAEVALKLETEFEGDSINEPQE